MPGVRDEQDDPADPEISLFDAHAPLHRLQIIEAGLRLDHRIDRLTIDDDVGAAQIPGQRNGNLDPPAKAAPDAVAEPFDQCQVGGVANRRAGWKEPDAEAESESRRDHRDPIDRHPLELAALQTTDRGVGQTDDRTERSLAESGCESTPAQLLASPLSLTSAHPDTTLPDALVRSHGTIMRTIAYLAIN